METERAYLAELVERLQPILGEELVGVYAGGSWALGGYEPGRSDLDVSVVVRRPLTDAEANEIVGRLRHEAFPCPARGIDLVVYTSTSAATPNTEPAFELNLNTGGEWTFRADRKPQPGERHWFAIDRSVLARHGIALFGPPASEVFAAVEPAVLQPLLADVLRWYEREDPESDDAVLNAGRSLRFAREGVWLPKPALRSWAAAQPGTNAEILRRAIAELDPPAESNVPR
ncbi:MAG TPA: nucleotidyltransferase domain-containing protein [Gaiellaceae bacterium]|nr:nucleotidyltransferase domain-containing protein [Gaiellaceae bacterium]